MNKIMIMSLLALTLCTSTTFAQSKQPEEEPFTVYASGGISISNGNSFMDNTFPSLEVGIIQNNTTFGINVGRSNLNFSGSDYNSNYYIELKNSVSTNIGAFQGYTILGLGTYFNTSRIFIEYRLGLGYPINDRCSFTTGVSNWDGTYSLSPGLTYNFRW